MGAAGQNGAPGAAGADGRDGAAGAQGAQGVAGAAGPQGLTGAQGSPGAAGPKGEQGARGLSGYSVRVIVGKVRKGKRRVVVQVLRDGKAAAKRRVVIKIAGVRVYYKAQTDQKGYARFEKVTRRGTVDLSSVK